MGHWEEWIFAPIPGRSFCIARYEIKNTLVVDKNSTLSVRGVVRTHAEGEEGQFASLVRSATIVGLFLDLL